MARNGTVTNAKTKSEALDGKNIGEKARENNLVCLSIDHERRGGGREDVTEE